MISELNAADQYAKELVSPLTVEQLNWQTGGGAWSVGQCLEHLCVAKDTQRELDINAAPIKRLRFSLNRRLQSGLDGCERQQQAEGGIGQLHSAVSHIPAGYFFVLGVDKKGNTSDFCGSQ